MNLKDLRDAVYRLKEEKFRLQMEYLGNGGEETESTISREQAIADLKLMLTSKEGVDTLGRFIRSNQDDIQGYKNEKKFIDTQIKNLESFNDWLLELTDEILQECDEDKAKGNLGYSFTQHTSVTTKVDSKILKERFFDKVEQIVRESGVIPEDVTFTLSASISRLPEGSETPEWYNTTSVGKATFRKPRKADDQDVDEFSVNEF